VRFDASAAFFPKILLSGFSKRKIAIPGPMIIVIRKSRKRPELAFGFDRFDFSTLVKKCFSFFSV